MRDGSGMTEALILDGKAVRCWDTLEVEPSGICWQFRPGWEARKKARVTASSADYILLWLTPGDWLHFFFLTPKYPPGNKQHWT
jgi:hypothetical protein